MTPKDLKIIKLSGGEQIICYVTHEEGSAFVRLVEPMELKIHSNVNDYGAVDETICLTDWVHHSNDNVFSIHKDRIMTIARPDDSLQDYYATTKEKYDNIKKIKEEERKTEKSLQMLEDSYKNENKKLTKKELYDIISGKITKH